MNFCKIFKSNENTIGRRFVLFFLENRISNRFDFGYYFVRLKFNNIEFWSTLMCSVLSKVDATEKAFNVIHHFMPTQCIFTSLHLIGMELKLIYSSCTVEYKLTLRFFGHDFLRSCYCCTHAKLISSTFPD